MNRHAELIPLQPSQALVNLSSSLLGHGRWTEEKPEPGQDPRPSGKPAGELSRSLKSLETTNSRF